MGVACSKGLIFIPKDCTEGRWVVVWYSYVNTHVGAGGVVLEEGRVYLAGLGPITFLCLYGGVASR